MPARALLPLGIAALVLWPALLHGPYDLRLFALAGIYAIAVLGYQFVFGHAGVLSLAQGTFFGLGAYVAGLGAIRLGLPFAAAVALAAAAPTLLAAAIAVPVLRLQSHYFALATLGVGQVVLLGAVNWESVTGGANGLPGVPAIALFGLSVGRGWPLVLLVWTTVAVLALLAWQVTRGPYGRALLIHRTDPLAAASLGVDGARLRFAALLLSAAYAGVAGGLYVHTLRVVSPEALEFPVMVSLLAMTVVGGATRIAGAIVGALLLVHLPEWFRVLEDVYLVAYGAGLLAFVVFAPTGLAGLLDRLVTPTPAPAVPTAPPAEAATPATLQVRGAHKAFGGVAAVDGVDLEVRPGEIHGLIGPNGSGKTTLVNLIGGLVPADAGSVRLGEAELSRAGAPARARAGLARSFQTTSLVEPLSALENAATGAAGRAGLGRALGAGWPRDREREAALSAARWALDLMGLTEVADRPAAALSPAQRRRLDIARALASGSGTLLLDEPAAGMTEAEQADLARRLAGLRDRGLGLLVIEHNVGFLMGLCDRLTCLESGRVLASGPPRAVRDDPAVRAAYLGDVDG